jgi:hypothetical protein
MVHNPTPDPHDQKVAEHTPPKEKRRGVFGFVAAIVAALVVGFVIGTVATPAPEPVDIDAGPAAETTDPLAPPISEPEPEPTPEPDPEPIPPTIESLTLTVVTDEIECFGSAGCHVTWHIEVGHDGTPFDQDTPWLIQYEMHGQDDGKHIGTFGMLGDSYEQVDGFSSVVAEDTDLTATVIRVTEDLS